MLAANVSVLLGAPAYFVGLVCAGILFAWYYLRFFQKLDNVRGDHSKSFAFASIFPEALQYVLGVVSLEVQSFTRG